MHLRVPRNTAEHISLCYNQKSRCSTPEDFWTFFAGIILIASGIRALAWLKKEEEQTLVLACYRFATLVLLVGDAFECCPRPSRWLGQPSKSTEINALKCVTHALSKVIVV